LKNTCRGPTNSTIFLETSTSTSVLPETPEKAQKMHNNSQKILDFKLGENLEVQRSQITSQQQFNRQKLQMLHKPSISMEKETEHERQ
jgi:hypothetical protein